VLAQRELAFDQRHGRRARVMSRLRLPLLAAALVSVLVLTAGCAAWRVGQSASLARQSEPFSQTPASPALRMLIVGDSTAVGTGASSPEHSVAGLMARDHPRLLIDNRAQDGARFEQVQAQLAGASGRFDIVLIQAGGNDVIRLRSQDALKADIERVADLASERASVVVVMPAGNVGNAPFFFAPWSWWMTQRARMLHRHVAQAATRTGAIYVNMFRERADDPFVATPSLNAVDGLHPSDSGYVVWWQALQVQAGMAQRLAPARALQGSS
jgi:lysophospholipase L1-like esterase